MLVIKTQEKGELVLMKIKIIGGFIVEKSKEQIEKEIRESKENIDLLNKNVKLAGKSERQYLWALGVERKKLESLTKEKKQVEENEKLIKKEKSDKAGIGKQFVILANSCFGENYYRVGDILTLIYSGYGVQCFRIERTGKTCTFSLSIAKEKLVEYNPSLAVNKLDAAIFALKTKEKAKPDIETIADHYGFASQNNKLIEECGELVSAIAKNSNADHVVEEMADVCIVIEQLLYLTKKEKEFREIKDKKIARQIGRIEKEIDQANTNVGCKLINDDLEICLDLDIAESVFAGFPKAISKACFGGRR